MLAEAVEQMGDPAYPPMSSSRLASVASPRPCAPTSGSCGGERRPRFIVVEPEQANCLQQSAALGEPVAVEGDLETLMAGLSCGEVSLLAWDILKPGTDDFLTLSEDAVAPCMQLLAQR